jgi:Rod binding domain-containing protein
MAGNLGSLPALASSTGQASLGALGLRAAQDARLPADTKVPTDAKAKARKSSVDFEAVFLNSMFNQMFTAVDGEGPFGGSGATGVWRSFLSDEYAKSFAKSGGIGIADHVYRSLITQQEASSK